MDPNAQRFVIVDLRIPFFRLVFFLVKLVLASIPAAFIVFLIIFFLSALIHVLFGPGAVWMEYWNR